MGWGKLGPSERGRETCSLYCEKAFEQRRACERREEDSILKTQRIQKGHAQEQELRSRGLKERKRKRLYSDNPGYFFNVGSWTEKVD